MKRCLIYIQPWNDISSILYQFIKIIDFTPFWKLINQVKLQMPQLITNTHILNVIKEKIQLEMIWNIKSNDPMN